MSKEKEKRFGEELVDQLEGFCNDLTTDKQISKKYTIRNVRFIIDAEPVSADEIKELREELCMSQAVFAKFIGISLSSLREWEQDLKPPSKIACRLFENMIDNIDHWKKQFMSCTEPV